MRKKRERVREDHTMGDISELSVESWSLRWGPADAATPYTAHH